MPEQATLSQDCVVDRRRRNRRSDVPSKRISARTKTVKDELDNDIAETDSADRRQVERRRQIDPTTCERDYGMEEVEFMNAMDDYKRRSGRPFPTWSEVLEVLRDLGYRKVAEPMQTYTGEE